MKQYLKPVQNKADHNNCFYALDYKYALRAPFSWQKRCQTIGKMWEYSKKKKLPWAILDISMSLREFSNFLTRMCPLISYHFWNLEALLFSPNLIFWGIFVRSKFDQNWENDVNDVMSSTTYKTSFMSFIPTGILD